MPVGSTVVDSSLPQRYSREDLLAIRNMQQDSRVQQPDVSTLFVSGWNPGHANGISSRGWGKPAESHVLPQEPDMCWEAMGSTKPISLQEMTMEEREVSLATDCDNYVPRELTQPLCSSFSQTSIQLSSSQRKIRRRPIKEEA